MMKADVYSEEGAVGVVIPPYFYGVAVIGENLLDPKSPLSVFIEIPCTSMETAQILIKTLSTLNAQ